MISFSLSFCAELLCWNFLETDKTYHKASMNNPLATILIIRFLQSDSFLVKVIYEGLYFDLAQGQVNGAPNETHS